MNKTVWWSGGRKHDQRADRRNTSHCWARNSIFSVFGHRKRSSHVRKDITRHTSKQPEQSDNDSAWRTLTIKAKQEQVSPVAFPKRMLEFSVSQREVSASSNETALQEFWNNFSRKHTGVVRVTWPEMI
jgi:hypothetical protein